MTPWIIISLATLIILLALIAIMAYKLQGGKKLPTDYYTFFVMGIVWTIAGIPLKNYALSAMGIIFMIIGIANKKNWKKNHEANKWKNLTKKQKETRKWLILATTIALLIGIIALALTFYLTK